MFYVTKSVKFDAAHFLPNYVGKCAVMHGHTWRVDVTIAGEEVAETGPSAGMLLDFTHLKALLRNIVIDRFDHSILNDELYNPTAENIAFDIYYALAKLWRNTEVKYELYSVRVYEGDSSWAEYKED